jgi:hypothetical protein
MRSIYKYELEIAGAAQHVSMRQGARVLCAQVQRGAINIWAEVDVSAPDELRTFYVVPTGTRIPPGAITYIGTVQQPPMFVWHVYAAAH